jgi:hypothetical protein
MHPEIGMGVEFARGTDAERKQVEDFIQTLMNNSGAVPELFVKPEGIDQTEPSEARNPGDPEDPLLDLFRAKTELATDDFLNELRKQRGGPPPKANAASAG